jgi:hypothetical protein
VSELAISRATSADMKQTFGAKRARSCSLLITFDLVFFFIYYSFGPARHTLPCAERRFGEDDIDAPVLNAPSPSASTAQKPDLNEHGRLNGGQGITNRGDSKVVSSSESAVCPLLWSGQCFYEHYELGKYRTPTRQHARICS